jgi:ribosomal protein L28
MLKMAMVRMAMAMGMGEATGNDLQSNHSPATSRRWLPNLTSLAFLMMIIMNP